MSVYVCVRFRMASASLRAPFSDIGRAFRSHSFMYELGTY